MCKATDSYLIFQLKLYYWNYIIYEDLLEKKIMDFGYNIIEILFNLTFVTFTVCNLLHTTLHIGGSSIVQNNVASTFC